MDGAPHRRAIHAADNSFDQLPGAELEPSLGTLSDFLADRCEVSNNLTAKIGELSMANTRLVRAKTARTRRRERAKVIKGMRGGVTPGNRCV